MKLFKKPSLKKSLGITKTKKKIKKELGVYKITKVTNAPKNLKIRTEKKFSIIKIAKKLFK